MLEVKGAAPTASSNGLKKVVMGDTERGREEGKDRGAEGGKRGTWKWSLSSWQAMNEQQMPLTRDVGEQ